MLINGDCLQEMDKLIADGVKVDAIITSPPYDDLRSYNESLKWNEDIWKQTIEKLFNILKQNGVLIWIVNDKFNNGDKSLTSFKQALYAQEIGFNVNDVMIWDKGNFATVGGLKVRYPQVYDFMFIFSKGKVTKFNPIKDRLNKRSGQVYHNTIRNKDGSVKDGTGKGTRKIKEYGLRHNVWRINPEKSNAVRKLHPATYPEQLVIDHLKSWTREKDLILDPFMGSGTTGVACKNLNRNFIGIEQDESYFNISKKRINHE